MLDKMGQIMQQREKGLRTYIIKMECSVCACQSKRVSQKQDTFSESKHPWNNYASICVLCTTTCAWREYIRDKNGDEEIDIVISLR